MAKLIELELAESYDVTSGYVWVSMAVDAGEIGSITSGGIDAATKEDVSEVYVKGMRLKKADGEEKIIGKLARGNWRELMQRVNDARV